MKIATKSACSLWPGAQGAIMTEDVVPAAAILGARRCKGYRDAGKQLRPSKGPIWTARLWNASEHQSASTRFVLPLGNNHARNKWPRNRGQT
eukprot:9469559-Pyramimonas_sp.AAC.1